MFDAPVICFGEVLWDCLPNGLFPGGAPINVAYHLRRFGLNAVPVTAVGKDFLGEELMRRFHQWNLSPEFTARVDRLTGAVIAELDDAGVASYRFLEDVAWDHIPIPPSLETTVAKAQALVFGTLAQRSADNRSGLHRLRTIAVRAKKVYDVNLRSPYDSPDLVSDLAKGCDLIKLNNEELSKLLGVPVDLSELEIAARRFGDRTDCSRICVTAGKHGSGLLWEDKWSFDPPQPITIKDTVGAGDSFLAALLHGWLAADLAPDANLQRAARVAEFVASCDGATPEYQLNDKGLPTID